MNSIEQIVAANNLRQADVIVLRKKFFGMLNHYAVFLGWDENTLLPVFAANYNKGTQFIAQWELEKFLQALEPKRIERFVGSELEREWAVQRGLSEIGKNDYDYFSNNCEHYKNFVQTGRRFSKQSEGAGKVVVVSGLALIFFGIFRK